jgi:RNA polymerase sigma-70 factor (ECF subfamily)
VGALDVAEDAVQDACTAALAQWPTGGLPANPRAWLIATARHKALDRLRREARRADKEAAAMDSPNSGGSSGSSGAGGAGGSWSGWSGSGGSSFGSSSSGLSSSGSWSGWSGSSGEDDELALIFLCCHPALDPAVRVSLTLRSVGGLTTAEIAAAFLVPQATMAKRLGRAKTKIRQAGIPLRMPGVSELAGRLATVLRVIYLIFTEGHMATSGETLVRGSLCDTAIRLSRALCGLLPEEPEVTGLLALLLLTDARRAARVGADGELVVLEEQDRRLWDGAMIAQGLALVDGALRVGRPGPYQLWAAIAACHSGAPSATETDWRQIAGLYGELIRYEPTAVVEANRAIAVAMAEGPG